MKTNQKQKNTPKGWQFTKLGDICDFKKGKGLPKSDLISDGQYEAIHYGELFTKYDEKINEILSRTNNNEKVFLSKENDILMPTSDVTPTGLSTASYIGKSGIILGGDILVIRPKLQHLNGLFFSYFVSSQKQEIIRLVSGTTVFHLYGSDMGRLQLNLPTLPEQKRIVAVLETWDSGIEKLKQKIAIKKEIKKGLMQELLTGKKRLPGFSEDWKKYTFEDLGTTYQGLTGKTKEDFGTGNKFISYMNIYSYPSLNLKSIKTLVDIKETDNQKTVEYGDLFFTTSSETPEEVGISSVLLDKLDEDIYLNSFCFGFRLNDLNILKPEFAKFYLRGQFFRKKMFRLAQGSSRFNLSKKYFLQTEIEIPEEEQKEIASILTSSEKEITALESKLRFYQEQKKYLLNNLVTGQIRTPENLLEINHK